MRIGRYELSSVVDARFAVDGGALFGVVPRPLWERKLAPDARNRVGIVARCLVAVDRDARRVILVDTGLGERWDGAQAEIYAVDRAGLGLDAGLARLGLARDDVTDVLLTHLHFDHAGGITRRGPGGALELSFPRAVHHLQRRAWQWAHAPTGSRRGGVPAGRLRVAHPLGPAPPARGRGRAVPGRGADRLGGARGRDAAAALPRRAHPRHLLRRSHPDPRAPPPELGLGLRPQHPVTSVEEKKVLVAEALEDDGVLVFGHDAEMDGCRLREEDGAPVFRAALTL